MDENLLCIGLAILAFFAILMFFFFRKQESSNYETIGTIVVDHSDGDANIFLEIAKDNVEQWENGRDYLVRVEVRDYLSQE